VIAAVVTRELVAEELPAVLAWVARHPGWAADYDEAGLRLNVRTPHPAVETGLTVAVELDGYPALPPVWRFVAESPGAAVAPFPQPGTSSHVTGSIFHPHRLICAPWNRLAYSEQGGVHADWGGLAQWRDAAVGYTKADTLADMLSQVHLHLSVSPGLLP
jgi:hypothetical protein